MEHFPFFRDTVYALILLPVADLYAYNLAPLGAPSNSTALAAYSQCPLERCFIEIMGGFYSTQKTTGFYPPHIRLPTY